MSNSAKRTASLNDLPTQCLFCWARKVRWPIAVAKQQTHTENLDFGKSDFAIRKPNPVAYALCNRTVEEENHGTR